MRGQGLGAGLWIWRFTAVETIAQPFTVAPGGPYVWQVDDELLDSHRYSPLHAALKKFEKVCDFRDFGLDGSVTCPYSLSMIDTRTTEETMKTTTYRNIPASTETRTESEIALQKLLDECRDYFRGPTNEDALATLRNEIEQFVDLNWSERKMAVELQAPIHQVREYLMVRACEPAAEQEEIA